MDLRNRYLVRRHCLVPLVFPTTDFCSLKGFALKLSDPYMHGIPVSMEKRTKGEKKLSRSY